MLTPPPQLTWSAKAENAPASFINRNICTLQINMLNTRSPAAPPSINCDHHICGVLRRSRRTGNCDGVRTWGRTTRRVMFAASAASKLKQHSATQRDTEH